MEQLPICNISFVTPEEERKAWIRKAISLYDLSKYETIIEWTEQEILLKRTDKIHDLLAYLAEQMIMMNKEKNKEIKGFLKWFEREIGAEIEELINKTTIKEYHEHSIECILDILKKNKKKIFIDPSQRKFQESLEESYESSLEKLRPLKEKIKATDNLIDEIVYRLYGLIEEEIKIIEGG